jgi:hypothetical protein
MRIGRGMLPNTWLTNPITGILSEALTDLLQYRKDNYPYLCI